MVLASSTWLIFSDFYSIEKYSKCSLNLTSGWKWICISIRSNLRLVPYDQKNFLLRHVRGVTKASSCRRNIQIFKIRIWLATSRKHVIIILTIIIIIRNAPRSIACVCSSVRDLYANILERISFSFRILFYLLIFLLTRYFTALPMLIKSNHYHVPIIWLNDRWVRYLSFFIFKLTFCLFLWSLSFFLLHPVVDGVSLSLLNW